MAVKEEIRELTLRQREGRAINAVAELLRRRLSVPNIYLEPPSTLISADILAVDRGGAGDLHAVEIEFLENLNVPTNRSTNPSEKLPDTRTTRERLHLALQRRNRPKNIASTHSRLMSLPAHFRYLAVSAMNLDMLQADLSQLGLYAQDGIGRLGIITITEKGTDSPVAEVAVAPERFRVDPAKLKTIETRLLAKSRPDIEVRI